MIIKRIEVQNFRALKDVSIDCSTLAAFVGRNGAGKSSILYALDLFYDISAKVSIEDFYNRDATDPITVRVTFSTLSVHERCEFGLYVDGDDLIVTKRVTMKDGAFDQRYFAAARQIREFSKLRQLGKRDRISEWKQLADSGKFPDLNTSLRSAEQVDAAMIEFENNNSDLCEPLEREEQFFGPRNIGGGKLDKYTKYVHIPAVRDASDEAAKKGSIHELIDTIVVRKINERTDVQELRAEFGQRVNEVYSPENLTELGELGSEVTKVLEQYAPGAELRLLWGDPVVPDIPPPPAIVRLKSDGYECPISHAGHGLQRSLVVALLHHLASLPSVASEGGESESAESGLVSPDLILGFEEPELYLHPSRCRYLADLLLQLTRPDSQGRTKNQVLYTTHSPYLVDLQRFDEVRLVRRVTVEGAAVPSCRIRSFSLDDAARELERINDVDAGTFTRDSVRARSLPVFTTTVNEGFFGDVVLVVEGMGDLGMFASLQQILGKNWSNSSIVIVPALGKENIDRPVVAFRGLEIPTYFVFDGDADCKPDNRQQTERRNARYLRLANAVVEELHETQVHADWAVFRIDIEDEVKQAVGQDVFDKTRADVATELGYDKPKRLLKNVEGAARFIEKLYKSQATVPHLEGIVNAVTNMRDT